MTALTPGLLSTLSTRSIRSPIAMRLMTTAVPRTRERRLAATYYRGGTSKALLIQREDLPPHGAKRDSILLSAMGSPDPNGR